MLFRNQADFDRDHICDSCGLMIRKGTEHDVQVTRDNGHAHLSHDLPIERLHPGCAPLVSSEDIGPGALT